MAKVDGVGTVHGWQSTVFQSRLAQRGMTLGDEKTDADEGESEEREEQMGKWASGQAGRFANGQVCGFMDGAFFATAQDNNCSQ